MVKRRRLETPSSDDLSRIEETFRSETSSRPGALRSLAPIAQVAAESAAQAQPEGADARTARATIEADAARLKLAEQQGLLMTELPLEQIDEGAMIRDRMQLGEDEMQELRNSIAAHGLRLPIEVFVMGHPDGQGVRYGLLSGYRRLLATRSLFELTEARKYGSIRAIIRPREDTGAAFVSMVEENEVREQLSHFERGRIAVIAANQGAFPGTEEAVNQLFASGSKAKRSKIRSFALIFEELGDMLRFPEGLTERRGLLLAQALRRGAQARLRERLSQLVTDDAEQEWAAIEAILKEQEQPATDPGRGGRPRSASPRPKWDDDKTVQTQSGVTIRQSEDSKGYTIRLEGDALTTEAVDRVMSKIQQLLEG